ncbi:MAG: hydantoinase/oxoprolinase family protein, partial [Theionarchaea archaeon]|nr:hydantoinase/oxoprolinase family protein [Theionarchaea archaeon]
MIIGCDVGGTFTDTVCIQEGEISVSKVPTTPHNFAEGVLEGIERLTDTYDRVIHGMTVGTNAVLQKRGACVTLITNSGFRDILEIG